MRLLLLHHARPQSLLQEAEYLTLAEPLVIDGVPISFIDMKFELYDNSFIFTNWVGQLPDGRYLLHTRQVVDYDPDPGGTRLRRLPDNWWDWAMALDNKDAVVKEPAEPIPPTERQAYWERHRAARQPITN